MTKRESIDSLTFGYECYCKINVGWGYVPVSFEDWLLAQVS